MPEKPARPVLSRPVVLSAALDLVDAEGLEALSIRRLAGRLGVDPMTVYRYADSKDDLFDGLVDLIYSRVDVDVTSADWQGELHRIADQFRGAVLEHPAVLPLVVVRPLTVPLARRPRSVLLVIEKILALLIGAGMTDEHAAGCYNRVVGWLLGYLLIEMRPIVDAPEEPDPSLRLGFQHLPASEFPHLRRGSAVLADRPSDLHDGLTSLIRDYEPYARRATS